MTMRADLPEPREGPELLEPLEPPEQVLQRFGPLGVSVCDGPFGIFRWHWKNIFVIELTERSVRGIRDTRFFPFARRGSGRSFVIPYDAIVSVKLASHPSPFSAMKVLSVAYRDGADLREKSIATWVSRAESAYALIRGHVPQDA